MGKFLTFRNRLGISHVHSQAHLRREVGAGNKTRRDSNDLARGQFAAPVKCTQQLSKFRGTVHYAVACTRVGFQVHIKGCYTI